MISESQLKIEVVNGKSITEISKSFGVSFAAVKKLCEKFNLIPKAGIRGGLNKKNMQGLIFGSLIVLSEGEPHPTKNLAMWKCQCICGGICNCVGSDLRLGKTKTCGCRKGIKSKRNWQGFGEIPKSKWRVIGQNAIQRKLEFTITIEFINELYKTQQRKCALSGMHIDMKNASLDRVNSYKGYTPDNIQWVHKKINKLKGQYDDGEFIDLCRKVANYNVLI